MSVGAFIDPPRLEQSPWRAKLEHRAERQGFTVAWWQTRVLDMTMLQLEVRNRELQVVRSVRMGKLSGRYDAATMAERVAEWLLDDRSYEGAFSR